MVKTLSEIRRERGLTQEQIGCRQMVCLIETGKRLPGPHALTRIANALGLPAIEVMAACRASAKHRRARK